MNFINKYKESQEGLIVFLHGLESSNSGLKSQFLNSNFKNTYIPELKYKEELSEDLFGRVYKELVGKKIRLIIGSSIGGYLAYSLCRKLNCPGLLYNPALIDNSIGIKFDETGEYLPKLTIVLGKYDNVVNSQSVVNFLNINYNNSMFDIFYENMGHRIPIEIFEKWTFKLTNMEVKTYEEFVSTDLNAKKGQWTNVKIPNDQKKKDQYENEFFKMIDVAYKPLGGHAKIKSPDDVFLDKKWDIWKGIDIDDDPDFDIIVWGETTPFGIKSCGVGHDGTDESKKKYLKSKVDDFNDKSKNYYGEVSDKLAAILINKYNAPVIDDPEQIQKILGDKKVQEFSGIHPDVKSGKSTDKDSPGKGWYKRVIGGHSHWKTIVGNPKI